jgi:cytoskeletal protein CcmA (bactofilin family)
MTFWKANTASRPGPTPAPDVWEPARFAAPSEAEFLPASVDAPPKTEIAPSYAAAPVPRAHTGLRRKESLIAADITIEGKIQGGGSIRISGKFKGDATFQGDLTIDVGAKLTGVVRAHKVTIAGELEGNVEDATSVEFLQTGVLIGDLKAGTVTVAAGARMRGNAEFGWDDDKGSKASKDDGETRAASGIGS